MSSINPLSSNIVNLVSDTPLVSATESNSDESGEMFSDILSSAMGNVVETDMADKASTIELLSGESDDLSGLLLDSEKAEIALNLSLQLRNKVLEAYDEIMRMQV